MMDRRTMIGLLGAAPLSIAAASPTERPQQSTLLFTDLGRTVLPADVRWVHTTGYSTTGRFAAAYALDQEQGDISAAGLALLAGLNAMKLDARTIDAAANQVRRLERRFRARSADGRWFTLSEVYPLAGHFGAVGDARYNEADGTFAGADDTAALQALVDWTLFWNKANASIRIGPGAYRTTRPIYIGRNTDYHTVTVEGDGASFGATFAGTRIFADHDLGPALALTGILRGGVRTIAVLGRSARWIDMNALGQLGRQPKLDDLTIAAWANPAAARQNESRYAPYTGIAIDPFRGASPSGGYDTTADMPAWLGSGDHYGNEFSSTELAIEKVAVRGFNTAFAIQPCASDGNGDFIRFRDCAATNCVHGWSIGNSQSRAVELHTCTANALHTVIDTAAHGVRNGCLQGRITLLSVSNAIQLFDFSNGLAVVGPAIFENLYCEAVYRLGVLGAGSAADSALAFVDCQLGFQLIGPRGVPRFILGCVENSGYGPGGSQGRVRFERCRLADFGPVLTLLVAARFADVLVDPATAADDADWRVRALRITAGGMITAGLALPTGDADTRYTDPSDRSTRTAAGSATIYGTASDRPAVRTIDKAALTGVEYDRGEWRFAITADPVQIQPGAVLLDLTSGVVFFVRDVAQAGRLQRITAIQQTDLTTRGTPATAPFRPASGVMALAN